MSSNTTGNADNAGPTSGARENLLSRLTSTIGRPGIMGNVPIVALFTLLGLLGGYAVGTLDSGTYSSTTVVNGNVAGTSSPPALTSSDIVGQYTATELSYFGYLSKQMQTAIAEETGQQSVTAPVAVVEKATPLIDITASSSTAEQSSEASRIAAEIYIEDWRTRTIAGLEQQIEATRLTMSGLGEADAGASEMQSQLASFQYALAATQSAERVVQPATPESATLTSSGTTIALLGGIVGLMAGLGVLLLFRRRRADEVDAAFENAPT